MQTYIKAFFAAAVLLFTVSCDNQGPTSVDPAENANFLIKAGLQHPYEQADSDKSALGKISTALYTLGSGSRVLLLVDVNTAGTTALVNAIVAAGYAITVRPPPEYTWDGTNPPLDDFDCVIHLNGHTFGSPLPVSAQTSLVNFVQNGGGFIGSQWNGFERATGRQTAMNDLVLQLWPRPDNCGGCNMTWTVVPGQESHPVLAGIPNSFTFFADGHDAGSQVVFAVNPSTRLMQSPGGGPAVLVREFGDGGVVNFSSAANYRRTGRTLQDPNIQQLYINALDWACGSRIIEVDVDIKPQSCPNPLNVKSKGKLPIAILGTSSFDVTEINLETITLAGVSHVNDGLEDVATPFNGDIEDCDDCTEEGADGFVDLTLKFQTQDIVTAIGDVDDGDCLTLTLEGELLDGTPIVGEDIVLIKKKK